MATTVLASIGDHGALNASLPTGLQAVWIDRDLSWLDFNERVLAQASMSARHYWSEQNFSPSYLQPRRILYEARSSPSPWNNRRPARPFAAGAREADELASTPDGMLPACHHPRSCRTRSVSAFVERAHSASTGRSKQVFPIRSVSCAHSASHRSSPSLSISLQPIHVSGLPAT